MTPLYQEGQKVLYIGEEVEIVEINVRTHGRPDYIIKYPNGTNE